MFNLGALLSLVAQKPEMAAQLDSLGIPPPSQSAMKLGGPQELGSMMPQGDPGSPTAIPGVESPGTTQAPWNTQVNPTQPADAANAMTGGSGGPSANPLAALAGLKGVVAPTAPQPIVSGGVSGGVKAPDMKAAGSNSAPGSIQALLAALLSGQGQNPLRTPDLGSFIRGGKY